MPSYEFEGKSPSIDPSAWVAPSADIIGDVRIEAECYVGWQAVLRGDQGTIVIRRGSAIEEGVIIHTTPKFICQIGPEATIGHGAILHNARIDRFAVVGILATVSNYARVGEWSIIGEMGLVAGNQQVPAESIAVGQPVKVIGTVTRKHKERWMTGKRRYQRYTHRNPAGLRLIL
jgi:carbonic anhydrase/acetyltransferase-like protein (isoleucine patch superfamily)